MQKYDGITYACGHGLPKDFPTHTHGLCAGCNCECHNAPEPWEPPAYSLLSAPVAKRICGRCGAFIADTGTHDEWHRQTDIPF